MKSIYDIVQYPNTSLFVPCQSLTKFSKAESMEDYLHEAVLRNGGLAVAANQLGLNIRSFFMKVAEKNLFAINPHVLDFSIETTVMNEGCLSIPSVLWHVRRPCEILLEYYDKEGNRHEQEFSGLEARVILHEIDHLDGILIPSYLDDQLFDVFIEAYTSNLNKKNTYIEIDDEVVVRY
jgi:peptide deformylase